MAKLTKLVVDGSPEFDARHSWPQTFEGIVCATLTELGLIVEAVGVQITGETLGTVRVHVHFKQMSLARLSRKCGQVEPLIGKVNES